MEEVSEKISEFKYSDRFIVNLLTFSVSKDKKRKALNYPYCDGEGNMYATSGIILTKFVLPKCFDNAERGHYRMTKEGGETVFSRIHEEIGAFPETKSFFDDYTDENEVILPFDMNCNDWFPELVQFFFRSTLVLSYNFIDFFAKQKTRITVSTGKDIVGENKVNMIHFRNFERNSEFCQFHTVLMPLSEKLKIEKEELKKKTFTFF